jgi:hypothetical protein
MSYVQLNEKLYKAAKQRATNEGYASVDEYVDDLVSQDVVPDDRYEYLFTAELLARLEQITGEIKTGGKIYTLAEVRGLLVGKQDE